MGICFPEESVAYRQARERLLEQEIALRSAIPEPGQDPRQVGTIEPLWNLLDLTPEGRAPDWEEQLSYCCHSAAR